MLLRTLTHWLRQLNSLGGDQTGIKYELDADKGKMQTHAKPLTSAVTGCVDHTDVEDQWKYDGYIIQTSSC